MVPNSLPLFRALAAKFDIAAIIPKPKSINGRTHDVLLEDPKRFPILKISRDELSTICDDNHDLKIGSRPFAILDVGGYFSGCAPFFKERYGEQFIGIVEDTENGHQKYDKLYRDKNTTAYPIYSVARSPLKEPEDFLVGQSIVYSVESIIRENYSLLINRQVLVIGYGKIGRSIASSLAVRNINVWVYDHDPIKRAQALSHGFRVPKRDFAISKAGMIFGATGNKSLSENDFDKLAKFAFVASVTSADDEFDFGEIKSRYKIEKDDNISAYQDKNGRIFYLIRDGEAVNFTHSNALGVFIYLVACEILLCLRKIIDANPNGQHKSIHQLSVADRRKLAERWIDKFFGAAL